MGTSSVAHILVTSCHSSLGDDGDDWLDKNLWPKKDKMAADAQKKAEAAERMERWGTTEEFTVITDEIIDAALTPRGGITRSQLEAVGLSWPKPSIGENRFSA